MGSRIKIKQKDELLWIPLNYLKVIGTWAWGCFSSDPTPLPPAPFPSYVLNKKISVAVVIKYSTTTESIRERAITRGWKLCQKDKGFQLPENIDLIWDSL